jgi:endonuclease YncB( thermonuclease family)
MNFRAFYFLIALAVFSHGFFTFVPAKAQEEAKAAADDGTHLPDRIIRPMRAIDPMTLRAEGVTIRLWGIKPALSSETQLEIRALDMMDKLIQEQQVNCKITGGTMPELAGRCAARNNQDLGLELLSNGYAIVDRHQTYDTVFATSYEKAQEAARLGGKGVWALVRQTSDQRGIGLPKWLEPHIGVLLPVALIFGPLIGLMIIALVARQSLRAMSENQLRELEHAHQKEVMLQSREREVLLTTLEGELTENKNKIEAFLVIYGDMLRSLRDTAEEPKYMQVGDIVQKHPIFNKTVFEGSVDKLSLLDITLAGRLSKFYASLPKEAEYINLDQSVPLDTAVKLVEKVLSDVESMLPAISALVSDLQNADRTPH